MYPVSDEYKLAVKQITRTFQLLINVFPENSVTMEEIEKILATVVQGVPDSEVMYSVRTVEDVVDVLATVVEGFSSPEDAERYVLYDNDIVTKTFKMSDNFVTGEDIEFGNAIAKDLAFTLTNYEGQWNDVDFTRATVIPMIGLLTKSGYEYVPMGTFWVDEASKPMSTISLKALDGMARFGIPFKHVYVEYPCNLKTLFFAICDRCGIRTRVTSFLNDSVIVQQEPENIEKYTCRDILAYIAMLAGCNARMSRDNYLEFVSFGSTGECHLEPVNRIKFVPEDYTIRITGLSYEDSEEEKTYFIGSDTYMLGIPKNPLMPSDPSDVLNNLLNSFEDFAHQPFTAEYFGDPAIDCGDIITNIHSNGKTYKSYVTNNTFTFKGPCSLVGKGRLPEVYNSPTMESKRDATIIAYIRKNRKEAERQISTLEQSIIQATNFMTQELGGYVYKTNNALYVMDTQDLETAKKLWKWGLGGFGYSANGKGGPFTTAITMDGQIVADFITAGTLNGELLKANTVQSSAISQSYKNEVADAIEESAEKVTQTFRVEDAQVLSSITETLKSYSTTSQTQSLIKQTADEITSSVNTKFASYSTTSEMNTKITQNSNTIMTEVNKKVNDSDFGTKITQNYSSVRIAWNSISKYIEFSGGAINIYKSTAQGNDNLLMKMTSSGAWYYYSGTTIGKIGTNSWTGDDTFRGLVFDLEYGADYMCWAHRESSNSSVYAVQLAYYANSKKESKGLHLECTTYCGGNLYINDNVRTINYSDGSGGLYSSNNAVSMHGKGCTFTCGSDFTFFNSTNRLVDCYNNIDLHYYSILNQSDARYKTNIEATEIEAIPLLSKIDLKKFDWIESGEHCDIGMIAQQLQEVLPALVDENKETGRLSIKSDKFIPYLIKAIQELTDYIIGDISVMTINSTPWTDNYTATEKADFIAANSYKDDLEIVEKPKILIPIQGGERNGT